MKYKLGKGTLCICPENLPEEMWLEDFIEKKRKDSDLSDVEIETKDNNGFRELSPDIKSDNVRMLRIKAEKDVKEILRATALIGLAALPEDSSPAIGSGPVTKEISPILKESTAAVETPGVENADKPELHV